MFNETKLIDLKIKTLALAKALNEKCEGVLILDPNDSEENQNERIKRTYEELLSKRRALYMEHGRWMRDLIDLKSYVYAIDLCKDNFEAQKKAYMELVLFLQDKRYLQGGLAGIINIEGQEGGDDNDMDESSIER